MHERRRDPRTSKPYSLENLLKIRAESAGLLLAVVGTREGFVMASSRDKADKQGARLAAHAADALFGRDGRAAFSIAPPSWPDVRLLGLRLDCEGREAFVAALVPASRAFSLEELGASVKRILHEPARRAAA